MSTPTIRALATAILAALLTVVLGAPAHADPDRLRLSLSQSGPFTESLSTPLFSGSYVPGTAASSFYVKNDSSSTTRATISVAPKSSYNAFEAALRFRASVGGQQGDVDVPLYVDKKKSQCRTIVTGPTINPGGVQKIDVTMLIDQAFPQPSSQQTASFSFVVTLSQVTNKGKVDVCGPQSPGGSVQVLGAQAKAASTSGARPVQELSASPRGSTFVAGTAVAFLVSGGLLLLFAVGRRRRTEPDA